MAESDFIFVKDESVGIGLPTQNTFAYGKNQLLNDTDDSDFAFIKTNGLGSGVTVGELWVSDRILEVGKSVDMRWDVQNNSSEGIDYTTEWKEDGSVFSTQTETIVAGGLYAFRESRTKNDVSSFKYQANDSRIVPVAWLNIIVDSWEADPYTPKIDEASQLELVLSGTSNGDIDVDIEFLEFNPTDSESASGTVIDTVSGTIPSDGTNTFTSSVTKDEEIDKEYAARITEVETGVSGRTIRLLVQWNEAIEPIIVNMVEKSFEDPNESDDSDPPTSVAFTTNDGPTYHYALADGTSSISTDALAWSRTTQRFLINIADRIYVEWSANTLTSEGGGPTAESKVDPTLGGVEPAGVQAEVGTGIEYIDPNFGQNVDSYDVSDESGYYYLGIGCESSTNNEDEVEMSAYDAWAEDDNGNKVIDFELPHEQFE